jgi:beta-phosphoglucomutase-like phosphatase (HAD superfamily)
MKKGLVELGIQMIIFDMAGTTVDEGGLVYKALTSVLDDAGIIWTQEEFDKWHGANKIE